MNATYKLNRALGRLFDAHGRSFDPHQRVWSTATSPAIGEPVDSRCAAAWLQRESGFAVRVPVGVIGPREATAEQLLAAGYAACFSNALIHVAQKLGTPLSSAPVTAGVELLALADGRFNFAITLDVALAAAQPRKSFELCIVGGRPLRLKGIDCYGFMLMVLDMATSGSMHSDAERVPLAEFHRGIRIFFDVIRAEI